jgi:hypothetical protein
LGPKYSVGVRASVFYFLYANALFMLQNVLRELEQKKPQLDELVHTAEHLKADSNRQQLHGKGEYTLILQNGLDQQHALLPNHLL